MRSKKKKVQDLLDWGLSRVILCGNWKLDLIALDWRARSGVAVAGAGDYYYY